MADAQRIKLIVATSVIDELNDLIDSLDEHITIEDVGRALGELRDKILDSQPKPYKMTPEQRERYVAGEIRAMEMGYPA